MTGWSDQSLPTDVMGSGDPVVLVPGGLTGWVSWKPHAERIALAYRAIRVQLLAVELGAHGEPLPRDYSLKTESRALHAAMDKLGIAQADFSGWSYGGLVLLDFALDNPGRVRSLTLIEPPAFWVLASRGDLSEEAEEFRRLTQSFDSENVTEEQLARFAHFAGFVPPNVAPQSMPQWSFWMQYRQSLRTGDVPFRHRDDIRRVRAFDKPVLLFKGIGSPGYLREIIDVLGQDFPHARVEDLPGAHALPIVSIDRYLEIFMAFIRHVQH